MRAASTRAASTSAPSRSIAIARVATTRERPRRRIVSAASTTTRASRDAATRGARRDGADAARRRARAATRAEAVREPAAGTARRDDVDDADADGTRSVDGATLDAFPDAFDDASEDDEGERDDRRGADADAGGRGGRFRTEGERRAAWALGLLTCAYCHASATGFLLPSLLPAMSADLKLDDGQGAVLTTLFTVTYSLLLPFVGVLADTVDRKNLLALGAATWTAASFMTAHSENFTALLISRGLFAVGNGAQNPVAFSMIPEMFPRNKALALSVYNLAIHAGRAVSFASGAFVGRTPLPPGAEDPIFSNEPITLPLTYLTEIGALGAHTILYTTADAVVLTPNVGTVLENTVGDAMLSSGMSWHQIYDIVALPGLIIVPLILFTIGDPGRTSTGSRAVKRRKRAQERKAQRERRKLKEKMYKSLPAIDNGGLVALVGSTIDEDDLTTEEQRVRTAARAAAAQSNMAGQYTSVPIKPTEKNDMFDSLTRCFDSEAFRQVTTAATLSDVAGWSMIAFQAAFYERVFSLTPQEYDPLLAMVIPIAGVTGGLGGGWICDRLQSRGPNGQRWFISIMTIAAGPLLAASLLADDYKTSLMYLFPGIVASEIFRAPTAVMTRDALPETPSVAAAAHLAVRNMVAGIGPLLVASLASKYDLQHALLLAPAFYVLAGFSYWSAIGVLTDEKAAKLATKMRNKPQATTTTP